MSDPTRSRARLTAKREAALCFAGHRIEPANAENLCAPVPASSEAAPEGAAPESEGKPERRRKKA